MNWNYAISNIAWPSELDDQVFLLLKDLGIAAIEIAPTRIGSEWNISREAAIAYRDILAKRGLSCSSLQAITYGKPELKLFGNAVERLNLLDHFKRVADLAAALGAGPVVLGAPKIRDRGPLGAADAFSIAADFFVEAGAYFAGRGVCLCLEPNPPQYGCNFVTTSKEGAALVRAVASPGFKLHLDAAAMHLSGEDPARSIEKVADVLEHFHASEPWLDTFYAPKVDHRALAVALRRIGWSKYISIEMRVGEDPVEAVRVAAEAVMEAYGACSTS